MPFESADEFEEVSDISAVTEQMNIELITASKEGNIKAVQELLDSNANVDYTDTSGITALMCATEKGHIKVVELLLKKILSRHIEEIVYNVENKKVIVPIQTETPKILDTQIIKSLILAIKNDHIKTVKCFIENKISLDFFDKHGFTPLAYAIFYQKPNIKKILEKAGADINSCDQYGKTPLIRAIEASNTSEAMSLIINGANVNTLDNNGRTPLIHAVISQRLALISMLIKQDADLKSKDKDGKTPLEYAIDTNDVLIVKILLENGAKLDILTSQKTSPLKYSIDNNSEATIVGEILIHAIKNNIDIELIKKDLQYLDYMYRYNVNEYIKKTPSSDESIKETCATILDQGTYEIEEIQVSHITDRKYIMK